MQERSIIVHGLHMSGHSYFSAHFGLYVGDGTGGEGVSICLGDLPDAPFGDDGAGEGLRVRLLTHAERMEVYYDNEFVVWGALTSLRLHRFVDIHVAYGASGLEVRLDEISLVQDVVLSTWYPKSSWRFGIGAQASRTARPLL